MSDDVKNEITIVVNTCDSYSDVLRLFFASLTEFWPNLKFTVVINSERNVYKEYKAISHVCDLNDCSWGKRVLSTLNSIETEFVLMVYDDFILEDFVDYEGIIKAQELLLSDTQASVVYLLNTSLPVKLDQRNEYFLKVKDFCDYRLSSYPGLWRRKDLLSFTGPKDDPWAWELFGSYRTFSIGKNFYTLNPSKPDIFPYDHEKGGAIYRGKWVRKVLGNKIEKYQLELNPLERGYSDDVIFESRSYNWKLNFFFKGFNMIGLRVFIVMVRLIISKYNAKKSK